MLNLDDKVNLAKHFTLPTNDNCVINFSGGRSSAFMLYHIAKRYNYTLPSNVRVVFCNTGKEHSQTYRFVDLVGKHLQIDILWLEYSYNENAKGGIKDPKTITIRVDADTASRDGKPFNQLLNQTKMLPSVHRRICTQELKVRTIYRYMRRDLGWNKWHSVLGIRYDEPKRFWRIMNQPCDNKPEKLSSVMPMVHAEVTKADVKAFWKTMPFDLDLDDSLTNCDLCFLKGKRTKARAMQLEPGIKDWWQDWEEKLVNRNKDRLRDKTKAQWDETITIAKLHDLSQIDDMVDKLNDESQNCFCGD